MLYSILIFLGIYRYVRYIWKEAKKDRVSILDSYWD